jgi:type I restriction enzyme S subunit
VRATYQKYKQAHASSFSEIPEHWNEKKFGYLFTFNKGLNITKENLQDEGIPCISYGEIHSKFGFEVKPERDALRCVTESYLETSVNALLKYGDFIFADTSEDIEGSGNFTYYNSNETAFAGYHTIIAKPTSENNPRYLAYLFDSMPFRAQIQKEVTGTKVYSITNAILKDTVVLLPPQPEQSAIVSFLDEKTSRIDLLISKNTLLIEKLKERRKSLISQISTKGIPSLKDVKYKQAHASSFSEIPEHWNEKKFGYLFTFNKGLNITKENLQDEGIPCISYGEIHSKFGFEVKPERDALRCVTESYLETSVNALLKYGDFIFADTSEDIEGSGNFTYYNSNETAFAGYHTIIAKPTSENNPRYLAYLFDSMPFRAQIQKEVTGTKVYSITNAILKDTVVLLPPQPEQSAIVSFLDEKTSRIDLLISKIVSAMVDLKKYRSVLIADVVSGKIDVRDFKKSLKEQ